MDEKYRGVTWKKVFDSVTEKKGILDKREEKLRGGRASSQGLIDRLQKNIRVCLSAQIKGLPSQVSLTNTAQKKVSILFSPG